ncbi:MAG TPA: hypothetical protein VGA70_13345 [Longimicrobiales bacterium]|jgi:hypothetical protein
MNFVFAIGALIQFALVIGAAAFLIHFWKKPSVHQLGRGEVEELREQVSLMRDFLRDAMERIRRLEDARGLPPMESKGDEGAGAERPARALRAPGARAAKGDPPGPGSAGPA